MERILNFFSPEGITFVVHLFTFVTCVNMCSTNVIIYFILFFLNYYYYYYY